MRMLHALGLSYVLSLAAVAFGAILVAAVPVEPIKTLVTLAMGVVIVLVAVVLLRTALHTIGNAGEHWFQRMVAAMLIVLAGAAVNGALMHGKTVLP